MTKATAESLLTPASLNQDAFLTIDNVAKIYPTKTGSYTVLQNVNLKINKGEFICLIGHSGCGKTTLLNMVSGFSQPSIGQVRVNGKPVV